MKLIGGYQNTKSHDEDFALTPYIFSVWVKEKEKKVYGIGLCWGFYSIYIGIGFNLPKEFPLFTVLK